MRKTTHSKRYDISSGRAIYVDYTNGSDTGNGSASTPLKTITAVNALKLKPRDGVMFKTGETWSNIRLVIDYSGKPNKYITISSYGSGAKPLIEVGANLNFAIYSDKSYLSIRDIEATGGTGCVIASQGHDVEIINTHCSGGAHDNIRCAGINGICYNIAIINNVTHSCTHYGGIYVGNGLQPDAPNNILILGNTCYSNGTEGLNPGDHGIYIGDVSNCLVMNNICYSNAGAGIKFNGTCPNLVIDGNYCYSNDSGIHVFGSGATVKNNFCTLNTSGGIKAIDETNDCLIANNTLLDNFYYGLYWVGAVGAYPTGNVIKNNLIYQNSARNAQYQPLRTPTPCIDFVANNTIDYNLYYFPGGGSDYIVNPEDINNMTFTQWQNFDVSPDAHSLNVDPKIVSAFTNPHLQSNSPCIGVGATDLGVLTDYDGVVRGAAVDIGAYEYV